MRAIMTTDTKEKTFAVRGKIAGKTVRIGGMVKGAGMIHPQLATMISIITTDAELKPVLLERILRRTADRTFNCLTVDGDTSTNDMVLLIANGASGVKVRAQVAARLEQGLEKVCEELAKRVARDGEGASKFVEVLVKGAKTFEDARRVAKAVAHSPLVKTSLYGEEPNWGRILCAAGYSGVALDPNRIRLSLCGITVFRGGGPVLSARPKAERALKKQEVQIALDLGDGESAAKVWTCDLTHAYVDINANYIT